MIANTAWRNPAGQPGSHGGQNWHIDAGPHIPLPEGVRWPAEIPHPVFAIGVHIYLMDCALKERSSIDAEARSRARSAGRGMRRGNFVVPWPSSVSIRDAM